MWFADWIARDSVGVELRDLSREGRSLGGGAREQVVERIWIERLTPMILLDGREEPVIVLQTQTQRPMLSRGKSR